VNYLGSFTAPDTISDVAYSQYDDKLWITGYKNLKRCWKINKTGGTSRWFASPATDYGCGMAFNYKANNEIWFADRRTAIGATAYIYVSDTLGSANQYNCPIQGYMNARCLAYDSLGKSFLVDPAWNIRGIEVDPRDGNFWITIVQGAPSGDNSIVKVKGFYTPPVGVEETPSEPLIRNSNMSLYPTISDRVMHIRLQLPQGRSAMLTIYDISGRVVKDMAFAAPSIGYSTTITWDGRDNAGRSVPAGVYFVSFEAEDCQKVEKAIIVR
jgi:hypothetical protein